MMDLTQQTYFVWSTYAGGGRPATGLIRGVHTHLGAAERQAAQLRRILDTHVLVNITTADVKTPRHPATGEPVTLRV